MKTLQWKYRVSVDVEETAQKARRSGFSVRTLEGQAAGRHQTEYPLGQIEIKDSVLKALNAKIVVSPHVTQVYKKDEVAETDKIERILKDIVVLSEGETAVFGNKTLTWVKTISLLELKDKLKTRILRIQEEERMEFERCQAQARLNLKGEELSNRLEEIWKEMESRRRSRLQTMVRDEIPGAKAKLDRFNEGCAVLNRWSAELALAKTPEEEFEILMKQGQELDREICDGSES